MKSKYGDNQEKGAVNLLISERIFFLMDQKGLSQKEFSEQTGISQSTISDWKRKKTNPSADKILKICEVLNVTPYEILAEGGIHTDGTVDYIFALNQEEEFVLESFRGFDKRQKERLLGYIEALKENR